MELTVSRGTVARFYAVVLLTFSAQAFPRDAFMQADADAPALTAPDTGSPLALNIAGTRMQLESSAQFSVGTAALIAWVDRSARAIERYYGQFPTTFLRVRLVAVEGRGVRRGTAVSAGFPHAQVRIELGREVTAAELREDWILVHEMAHLALPDVGFQHAWLAEGLATYVEGVARAQAGDRTAAEVWAQYLRSMPRGLPRAGDRGLDHTYRPDQTYWGGAIFCLLADVKIRRETNNKRGLQDALRAVARSSGGLRSSWTIREILETADEAVGTTVLQKQYAKMKDRAVRVDLPWLWSSLGIEADGDSIVFHDDAPFVDIRKTITRAPARERLQKSTRRAADSGTARPGPQARLHATRVE